MDLIDSHLLTLILFFPAVAALVVILLPKDGTKTIRWFALAASLVPFALSVALWARFHPDASGYQFA